MANDFVVLVDENDCELGTMEKMEAHQKGLLHRAFSIFIFNDRDELLLQQRALTKYHSAGLWTNTCCSHPRPNETIKDAANRRLFEEMGMVCDLTIKTSFIYKTPFSNGLTEHELDYVLTGTLNNNPTINTEEVENFKWMTVEDIKKDLLQNNLQYTSWFIIAIQKLF